ncbi:amidohydrolase [Leucobacter chromiireducens]|uniref:amidohydrolase n=1 Tax=Leucobacter chromiireducens TaxID=283877 RepID=UPI000F633B76|nr:amidohydrolase family protein [Leucobacter chromiireducens]
MISQLRSVRMLGQDAPVDVVIEHGRIARIAPAGAAARLPGGLDADGRFLTSGLWDEHVHFGQWAQQSSRFDLGAAESAAEALELLAAGLRADEAAPGAHPGAEFIAVRARAGAWTAGITRAALDAIAGARPLLVIGADLHGVWLNSAALAARGLPVSGDGHIVEDECFALLRELDSLAPAALDELVARAGRAAAARGVVGIVDLEMRWCIDDWLRREAAGFELLRVEAGIYPNKLDRAIEAGYRSGDPLGRAGLLTVGPLKMITDGSLGTGTAWCCDPYPTGGHGRSLVSADDLLAMMRRATAAELDLTLHAIGDRAVAQVLDAYAALGRGGRMEHAQLLREADIARFAELGITASVQPEHLVDDREATELQWPGRAARSFPLATLHASGAHLVFGSDAPVAPLDPWRWIQAAVTRSRPGESPWTPAERIPVAVALAASMRGALRPAVGDLADLVLLDRDPLRSDPEQLSAMGVAATLVGGRLTHRAPELAP